MVQGVEGPLQVGVSEKVLPSSGWEAEGPALQPQQPKDVFAEAAPTSVVAAGILQRLALVDAVEALTAAVEVGRSWAPGDPAARSRDPGGAW